MAAADKRVLSDTGLGVDAGGIGSTKKAAGTGDEKSACMY
jgi:hypothetical protein